MKLHILGICGTFMGGIAALARAAGHEVSGSDSGVFPPMSTQLEQLGIELHDGYDAAALGDDLDAVVVGNVMSRGNPAVEHMLAQRMPYVSGPEWLARHVLSGRHVLAVAGTHGKTSTASMLAWVLDRAGLDPGFLIGGVPVDFGVSARLGSGDYFVVEADEYDTAFFDKRSKFVHYRPATLVITNLEYDHADIFPDLAAICRQFHHLVRTVPGNGRIIVHADSPAIDDVLAMGCWTPVWRYDEARGDWSVREAGQGRIAIAHGDQALDSSFAWPGRHNRLNALAASAAAQAVGVDLRTSLAALASWRGVRRRLEQAGRAGDITVYDDFAHHPTEIAATLEALRGVVGDGRLTAVFEPRSNSMKMGVHRAQLANAFGAADRVLLFEPPQLQWNLAAALRGAHPALEIVTDYDELLARVAVSAAPGDHVVFMSNGAFGGLPGRLVELLKKRRKTR